MTRRDVREFVGDDAGELGIGSRLVDEAGIHEEEAAGECEGVDLFTVQDGEFHRDLYVGIGCDAVGHGLNVVLDVLVVDFARHQAVELEILERILAEFDVLFLVRFPFAHADVFDVPVNALAGLAIGDGFDDALLESGPAFDEVDFGELVVERDGHAGLAFDTFLTLGFLEAQDFAVNALARGSGCGRVGGRFFVQGRELIAKVLEFGIEIFLFLAEAFVLGFALTGEVLAERFELFVCEGEVRSLFREREVRALDQFVKRDCGGGEGRVRQHDIGERECDAALKRGAHYETASPAVLVKSTEQVAFHATLLDTLPRILCFMSAEPVAPTTTRS